MQRINVFVAGDLPSFPTPFAHGEWEVIFHRWSPAGLMPLLEGATFAFIDWLLPEMSSIEVCRRLRCNPLTANCHIVMVLDPADKEARRRALAAGADDFMPGPIERGAILDRILASRLAEMIDAAARGSVSLGELTVDMAAHQARWKGKPLGLMPNDLRLLRYFVEHPGRIFTRSQLIAALGKQAEAIDERTVDVWVGRLRRALRDGRVPHTVRTVRSIGYVLDQP